MHRHNRFRCACLLTLVLAAASGPGRAGVRGSADISDLLVGYQGKSFSNTDPTHQGVSTNLGDVKTAGTSFTASQFFSKLPSISGVRPAGGFQFPVQGTVTSKGKVSYSGTATGQHAGLKVSLKGTLTANGQGIFGAYTMKLGKQTLDKGTFFMLPP